MTNTLVSRPRLDDPKLSRFDPLNRIIAFDDFDTGLNGWCQLLGNYEHCLDTMRPEYAAITAPMLSNISHWDGGSHGSFDGNYSLKIASRPEKSAMSVAIKRLTFRKTGPIRLEFYFCAKPEANSLVLSHNDLGSIGFLFDLQGSDIGNGGTNRVMPHIRYLNSEDGVLQQKWQFKSKAPGFHNINDGEETVSHVHLADRDWEDLPGGDQRLCYNEIPTKINWHYLRFDFDLDSMSAIALQCNDRQFPLETFESMRMPAMKNLWCMLNICLFAQASTNKRSFLYVDSVCLSGDF